MGQHGGKNGSALQGDEREQNPEQGGGQDARQLDVKDAEKKAGQGHRRGRARARAQPAQDGAAEQGFLADGRGQCDQGQRAPQPAAAVAGNQTAAKLLDDFLGHRAHPFAQDAHRGPRAEADQGRASQSARRRTHEAQQTHKGSAREHREEHHQTEKAAPFREQKPEFEVASL